MSTPSTDEVRHRYATGAYGRSQSSVDQFDRWLAAHDAEVRASVTPSTEAVIDYVSRVVNDPKYGHDAEWLRLNLRASHLRQITDAPTARTVTAEQVEAAARALYEVDCDGCEPADIIGWSREAEPVRAEYRRRARAAAVALAEAAEAERDALRAKVAAVEALVEAWDEFDRNLGGCVPVYYRRKINVAEDARAALGDPKEGE